MTENELYECAKENGVQDCDVISIHDVETESCVIFTTEMRDKPKGVCTVLLRKDDSQQGFGDVE